MPNEKKLARSIGTKLTVDEKLVGSITSLEGPGMSTETTDVTSYDSTGGCREFMAGLKDGGEVPVSGYLDSANAGQNALYAAYEDAGIHKYVITFPNGAVWSFDGLVTAFKHTAPLEGVLGFEASIKVSGLPSMELPAAAAAANVEQPAEPQEDAGEV